MRIRHADYPGKRFGRLIEQGRVDGDPKRRLYLCDCGNTKSIRYNGVRAGTTASCGCLRQVKAPLPKVYEERPCVVCDTPWRPQDRSQAARNETCGKPECRATLIADRRGRDMNAVRAVLAERSAPGDNGCIVWAGPLDRGGYARMGLKGRRPFVHRLAWEVARSPIPEGFQVDHLCRNRACINPDHLEPVTQEENLRREWVSRRADLESR